MDECLAHFPSKHKSLLESVPYSDSNGDALRHRPSTCCVSQFQPSGQIHLEVVYATAAQKSKMKEGLWI
jgi:hypothetical protein